MPLEGYSKHFKMSQKIHFHAVFTLATHKVENISYKKTLNQIPSSHFHFTQIIYKQFYIETLVKCIPFCFFSIEFSEW